MKTASSPSKQLGGVVQALRLRGPLSNDPTARVLHALLLTLLVWLAFWVGVRWPINTHRLQTLMLVPEIELALAAALAFLHFGRFRAASLTYLAGAWLFATGVMLLNGGIRSTIQVIYVTLPISAVWLLGYRAALWIAGACISSSLVFALLEINGVILHRYIPGASIVVWATFVQAALIGAVPISQVLRTLQDALNRSRRSEEELRDYKERLEQLVEQRTSELVEARDQATAACDEAQTANRANSTFLANMSHELRTPLNAILGFSNLLRDSHVSAEEQRKDLDIINRSGEHLLGLINDLLDMAKIEAGGMVLEIGFCDLEGLVNDLTEMMRLRAQEKRLALLLLKSPDFPCCVRADASRIRQVLINLLSNALKYTDHGSVTLRLDARPADPAGRLLLAFEVEDTGVGIAPEDQALIFDAFVQVGKSRAQKGTGLGLAITRQLIKLMGGTIQVHSILAQGSLFRVEIPVTQVQAGEAAASAPGSERILARAPGQPDCRVLIVDDEQENAQMLQRLLQNAGIQVQMAADGAQAVARVSECRPHFIWMDLNMPGMSGIEATRRIRALEGGRDVKIAAVTAAGFKSDRTQVLEAGLDDYVRKPYRSTEIFDCMARHLGVLCRHSYGAPSHRTAELWPKQLAALPRELRAEMSQALIALDVQRVSAAVKSAGEIDAALGAVLASCAGRYGYTAMLNALEASKTESVDAA